MKRNRLIYQYIAGLAAVVIVLVLIWMLQLRNVTVSNVWTVDAGGASSFVAEDSVIRDIGLSFDDINRDVYNQYSDRDYSGTIVLESDGETVWAETVTNIAVSTLSVERTEGIVREPVSLVPGQEYEVFLINPDGKAEKGISVSFYGSERNFGILYGIVSAGILFFLTVLYCSYCGVIHLQKHRGLWWVAGILMLAVLETLVMTPLCVPDEELHFYSAYAVSNRMLHALPGLSELAEDVPLGILRMKSFGDPQYIRNFWTDWRSGNVSVPRSDSFFLIGLYPHYSYCIPALGITLMRILHAPWQMYLIAGRLCSALFFSLIMLAAMRIRPSWERAIAAITLLPSTLWLINSFSYDVWNLALIVLAVSYCAYLSEKKQVAIPELLLAVLLMISFIPLKFIYFNIALFLFLIPVSHWKVRNRRLVIGAVVSIAAVGIIVVAVSRGQEVLTLLGAGGFDGRSGNDLNSTYTVSWVLHHPARTVLVYLKSFYESGANLFLNMFAGDNFQGYIPGILLIPIIGCLYTVMSGTAAAHRRRRASVISLVVLLSGILLVMTSFLFLYSTKAEYGVGTITGMQGRYYLPFIICIPFLARRHEWSRVHARKAEYLLAGCTILSFLTRFAGIMTG